MSTVIVITILTVFFKGADFLPLRGVPSYSPSYPSSYSSYYPSPYNSYNSFDFDLGYDGSGGFQDYEDDLDDYLDDQSDMSGDSDSEEEDYDFDDNDDDEGDYDFDDSDDDEDDDDDDGSYGSFNVINNYNVSPQIKNGKLYVNGKTIVDVKSSDKIDIIKNEVYKNDTFICTV